VCNTATLPNGEQAAILQAERRARIVACTPASGAHHAEVEPITAARPTPRVEAATRELRVVLEEIAKLRQSRRLPEILRTITEARLTGRRGHHLERSRRRAPRRSTARSTSSTVSRCSPSGRASTSPSCR
jgi:hypothetical protein